MGEEKLAKLVLFLESASEPVTAVIKSQVRSKEKKIFRVKKRTSVPVEEGKEGVESGDIE